jgi:hypothetical protein
MHPAFINDRQQSPGSQFVEPSLAFVVLWSQTHSLAAEVVGSRIRRLP